MTAEQVYVDPSALTRLYVHHGSMECFTKAKGDHELALGRNRSTAAHCEILPLLLWEIKPSNFSLATLSPGRILVDA